MCNNLPISMNYQTISHFAEVWNNYRVYANQNAILTRINGKIMHQIFNKSPGRITNGVLAYQLSRGDPMWIELRNIHSKYSTN